MLTTNSGLCKRLWLLIKRHVYRSLCLHTRLCSCRRITVACTFLLLSQALTAALHLKMDVPRMNQLSHCWSEGATQQRRGVAKTVSSEDFTSFNSVYSAPTLHTAPTVGERPHWLFFLPFHPLLSHGKSRLVAEVILIVFPVLRDLRSWVINAHSVPAFTFKNMVCRPKRCSCTKLVGGEKCASLSISSLAEPYKLKQGSPLANRGYQVSIWENLARIWVVNWALAFASIPKGRGSVWEEGPCMQELCMEGSPCISFRCGTKATHSQVSLGKAGRGLLWGHGGNLIILSADVRIS